MKDSKRELSIEGQETAPDVPFAKNRYTRLQWNRESILLDSPEASGVYGLFNALWIYIGEAENIRMRLLEHLAGDNPCITHYQPTGFAFELLSAQYRSRRQQDLVNELLPLCRGKAFAYRVHR